MMQNIEPEITWVSIRPDRRVIEALITVIIGMLLHLNGLSVLDVHSTYVGRRTLVLPNLASAIYVFSTLCLVLHLRPKRSPQLRNEQHCLLFLMESALVLGGADMLLHYVWNACLRQIDALCNFLALYTEVNLPGNGLRKRIAMFMREDCFFALRLWLALIVFFVMLSTYNLIGKSWRHFVHWIKRPVALRWQPVDNPFLPLDAELIAYGRRSRSLDHVPPQDAETMPRRRRNSTARGRSRQRRGRSRQAAARSRTRSRGRRLTNRVFPRLRQAGY